MTTTKTPGVSWAHTSGVSWARSQGVSWARRAASLTAALAITTGLTAPAVTAHQQATSARVADTGAGTGAAHGLALPMPMWWSGK